MGKALRCLRREKSSSLLRVATPLSSHSVGRNSVGRMSGFDLERRWFEPSRPIQNIPFDKQRIRE